MRYDVYLVDDEMPLCVIAFVPEQRFCTDLLRARCLRDRIGAEGGVRQQHNEGDNTQQGSKQRTLAGLPTSMARPTTIGGQTLMIIALSRVRHNVHSNLTEVTWIPRWDIRRAAERPPALTRGSIAVTSLESNR